MGHPTPDRARRASAGRAARAVRALLVVSSVLVLSAACTTGDSGRRRAPRSTVGMPGDPSREPPTTSPPAPLLPVTGEGDAATTVDPCALVTAAEATELIGSLSSAPVPQSREGRRVACTYTPSAGGSLSLTVDPPSFFDRAADVLAEVATVSDDSIVVESDTYVAVWFRTDVVVVGVNGPPGHLSHALALAERAERNLLDVRRGV